MNTIKRFFYTFDDKTFIKNILKRMQRRDKGEKHRDTKWKTQRMSARF